MKRIKGAALAACSNGQNPEKQEEITALCRVLSEMGIRVTVAEHLYAGDGVFSGTAKERADDLMKFYLDDTIDAIFDVSGGDIANEILGLLDYELISKSDKMFWGYSDLSTIINAIYTKTGKVSSLYQIKNLIWADGERQRKRFGEFLAREGAVEETSLYAPCYDFVQGNHMEGVVIGGNVRCFLKLAGTPYFPEVSGKILLLEALGGGTAQITTYFSQLEQMGVFEKTAGIILGTFTNLEQAENKKVVFELLKPHIKNTLPVAKTQEIGHESDAKAIRIGAYHMIKVI